MLVLLVFAQELGIEIQDALELEGLDVEGNTVRIKGDVLILAYDDV